MREFVPVVIVGDVWSTGFDAWDSLCMYYQNQWTMLFAGCLVRRDVRHLAVLLACGKTTKRCYQLFAPPPSPTLFGYPRYRECRMTREDLINASISLDPALRDGVMLALKQERKR